MATQTIIFEDSTNSSGYFNKSNSVWAEALSPYMTDGVFNEGLDVRLQVNDNAYETLTAEGIHFSSEGEFVSENYRIIVNSEDIRMEDQEFNVIPNATIKIALFEAEVEDEEYLNFRGLSHYDSRIKAYINSKITGEVTLFSSDDGNGKVVLSVGPSTSIAADTTNY